jgi:hypothetical protein
MRRLRLRVRRSVGVLACLVLVVLLDGRITAAGGREQGSPGTDQFSKDQVRGYAILS